MDPVTLGALGGAPTGLPGMERWPCRPKKKKRHATGRHRAGLTQHWLPRTGHHLWAFRGTPSPRRSGSG